MTPQQKEDIEDWMNHTARVIDDMIVTSVRLGGRFCHEEI